MFFCPLILIQYKWNGPKYPPHRPSIITMLNMKFTIKYGDLLAGIVFTFGHISHIIKG